MTTISVVIEPSGADREIEINAGLDLERYVDARAGAFRSTPSLETPTPLTALTARDARIHAAAALALISKQVPVARRSLRCAAAHSRP